MWLPCLSRTKRTLGRLWKPPSTKESTARPLIMRRNRFKDCAGFDASEYHLSVARNSRGQHVFRKSEKQGSRWTISYRNNISSKSRICGTLSPNQPTLFIMSESIGLLLDVEDIPKQDCHDRQLPPENEHRACFTVRRSLILQLKDLFDSFGWIADTPRVDYRPSMSRKYS